MKPYYCFINEEHFCECRMHFFVDIVQTLDRLVSAVDAHFDDDEPLIVAERPAQASAAPNKRVLLTASEMLAMHKKRFGSPSPKKYQSKNNRDIRDFMSKRK